MRKLLKLITSRLFWVALICAIQLLLIVYIVFWASFGKGDYLFFLLLTMVISIIIATRDEKAPYKMIWMFMLVIFPFFGAVFYVLFANKKLGRFSRKKLKKFMESIPDTTDYAKKNSYELSKELPEYKRLSDYIENVTGKAVWGNTKVSYFAYGEDFFPDLLGELRRAKRFIFIEYFIIGEGKRWNSILEILKEKASQGVDVRVMYDDLGSINVLPYRYDKTLSLMGIKAVAFNKVRFHVNPRMNYRDHRKILSIDGNICYTGGLNLSDEYSNDDIRFGYWKDNAIKLEGASVWNLTLTFLRTWCLITNTSENLIDYTPTVFPPSDGFIQPFDDTPLDSETVAEGAYIQLINSAKRYIWITTPYLVPDDTIMRELCIAALSGIDVRIITPHHPDKKSVYEVTKANYQKLMEAGVKIYEFIPGFIHSKTFIVDDEVCCIGTVNIDYRSFYLHYELSVLLYRSSVIASVKKDMEHTFDLSEEQSMESIKQIRWYKKLIRVFFKLFSPAL